ncbi:small conductance mechanosensitive channel [Motilibacter rhizosphaerae]|uniref:Small conductance mechanosensitive channel n=1 Tax=Motilibacter rhizosphaerae TaxID=598652 RepID=A0A4Q7NQR4_9ACTN|nr:mechanosensitive ion channel family protein [Motilibacter rhizosphaerae]RZS87448.1 small conductance mechanosensitive channel [Motilibacter rhizosphaerae]
MTLTDNLSHLGHWLRGSGLEIVLLVLGAILVTRTIGWVGELLTSRIDARAQEEDALVRSEAAKHRHAVAQVLTWATIVVIWCVTAVLVARDFGIPLTGLVAPATVAGVALGFGAQRIVQDLLAGFFIITERQYGYGDVIRMAVIGTPAPAVGTVEDVTLRVTSVRSIDGEVITTPNGQIVQVTNLSRGWARAVVDVPVPAHVTVEQASRILRQTCQDAFDDPELQPLLLDAPSVMGVETIDVDTFSIRVVARTLPGKQFDVARALRGRVADAFLREGILASGTITVAAEPSDPATAAAAPAQPEEAP